MPLRIFALLSLIILSACASSERVSTTQEIPVAAEPLPPEIKPLTMEQEEQVNALGGAR